ncbi:efflux RND transporter periplasmic adaptor subunit, partial [Pseudomonas sp. A-1]
RVAVTLGLRGTALSEVVEGLAAGDAVLAADAEPGQRVRLREQPLPAGVTE